MNFPFLFKKTSILNNVNIITILLFFIGNSVLSQSTKKVLFIGNSYIAVNNLPSIVNSMALNTNDILIYDYNTPGGYRLLNHTSDATTLSKINSNNWDFVVLQAQSQETALGQNQMAIEVFPYATTLSNLIRENNECSQPLFYMTWGRENGDLSNCPFMPWVCTYEGMDDVIRNSYVHMAQSNLGELAPAGAVWRYLRVNNPTIDLYSSDESHPSIAGSYAAACTLYTMIYKKDPTLITWNSSLEESVANAIKIATKLIVFDQIELWDFSINPTSASFSENIQAGEVTFTNTSSSFETLSWDFGDGNFSTEINPIHTYTSNGIYTVSLTSNKCGKKDVMMKTLEISTELNSNLTNYKNGLTLYPNPTSTVFKIILNEQFNTYNAVLFDNKGSILFNKENITNSEFEMDISALSSGIYSLKITSEKTIFFSKIIKI